MRHAATKTKTGRNVSVPAGRKLVLRRVYQLMFGSLLVNCATILAKLRVTGCAPG